MDNPKIKCCPCGREFFVEEGMEDEIYCEGCRDPWWWADD